MFFREEDLTPQSSIEKVRECEKQWDHLYDGIKRCPDCGGFQKVSRTTEVCNYCFREDMENQEFIEKFEGK